jgi:hypothetical protein
LINRDGEKYLEPRPQKNVGAPLAAIHLTLAFAQKHSWIQKPWRLIAGAWSSAYKIALQDGRTQVPIWSFVPSQVLEL